MKSITVPTLDDSVVNIEESDRAKGKTKVSVCDNEQDSTSILLTENELISLEYALSEYRRKSRD